MLIRVSVPAAVEVRFVNGRAILRVPTVPEGLILAVTRHPGDPEIVVADDVPCFLGTCARIPRRAFWRRWLDTFTSETVPW